MLVDGKIIASEIYSDLKQELENKGAHPCLTVFTSAPNAETRKFLELKKKRASEIGVDVFLFELDSEVSTEEAIRAIKGCVDTADGVVVQLPFPPQVDAELLLAAVPKELDVDALHYHGEDTDILPPVIGAIAEISNRHQVEFRDKKVTVVGQGRLVGQPAVLWAQSQGAIISIVDKDTKDADSVIKEADIVISGAGVPGLIKPEVIKDGVIIFDAGTSEAGGQLRGDADPECARKASLFTPVPGGIGPITIAILLRNLVILHQRDLEKDHKIVV